MSQLTQLKTANGYKPPTWLRAPRIFPWAGGWLLRGALQEWRIEFRTNPNPARADIDVSFIIPARGKDRCANLLTTLQTIAAQKNVSLECIVVEQANERDLEARLPAWVRYAHTPLPRATMPFNRAWALNVGARLARGKIFVFHDTDFLAPCEYAQELVKWLTQGYRAMRLQRFLFFLDDAQTRRVQALHRLETIDRIAHVMQDSCGGTCAVERETFFELGGWDENFVGWGTEDREFFQRCATTCFYARMYLPFVHMNHPRQPRSQAAQKLNGKRLVMEPAARIAELKTRNFGAMEQSDPPYL